MKTPLNALSALGQGFSLVGAHWLFLAQFAVLYVLLTVAMYLSPFFLYTVPFVNSLVVAFLWFFLNYLVFGLLFVATRIVDGEKPAIPALFAPINHFARYFFGSLFFGLAVGLGSLFLILPGIYVFVTYAFVPFLLAKKEMGIREAFGKSAELAKGNRGQLFIILVVTMAAYLFMLYMMLNQYLVFFLVLLAVSPLFLMAVAFAFIIMIKQLQVPVEPEKSSVI